MTLVMAYAVLVSAAIGAAAALVDLVVRPSRIASRWIWALALALIIPVTGFIMVVPREAAPAAELVTVPDAAIGGPITPVSAPTAGWTTYLGAMDVALAATWVLASALLLLTIGVGQWRLLRARRRARLGEVQGHRVLLTEDLGPAVAGLTKPVVFVPRWVVALDDASQRLLLAHEVEHARRRDTTLLMGGVVLTALLPWNPVVWWLTWRLRVAVELDCDRRVLAANPGVRRYVDLLLLAAAKPRISARLLAAHFGEHASDLERRIEAMTDTRLKWRAMLVTAMAAGVLIAVACDAPRPEPVAPGTLSRPTSALERSSGSTSIYYEFQVEKPVSQAPGSGMPRYPDILRQAGVEGNVLASFVVDEAGLADTGTFKALRSTHELFTMAVKQALPNMRFVPAEVGGKKVKQLVQQPFAFAIAGASSGTASKRTPSAGEQPRTVITGVGPKKLAFKVEHTPGSSTEAPQELELKTDDSSGKELAFTVRRQQGYLEVPIGSGANPPSVLILNSRGEQLYAARGQARTRLQDLLPESIQSVEILKGQSCSATLPCPLIKVTLKPGHGLPSATTRQPQ